MTWFDGLEPICRADAPLAPLTWFGLGGPARWLIEPRDAHELAEVLRRCAAHGIAWRVLGKGANLLVRDEGFAGAVIRLVGPVWEAVELPPATAPATPAEAGSAAPPSAASGSALATLASVDVLVRAAGGADFPLLVKRTAQRGLVGLENLAGIPGTVGGIVRMNAGGKFGSIGQFVREVSIVDGRGALRTLHGEEVGFAYRRTALGDAVVVGAVFALAAGDPAVVFARFRQIWNEKYASQPAVAERSAGCMFKNPPKDVCPFSAGALLDRAGLKGVRIGGAEISTRHANFIVAGPGATARDVLELVTLAQDRVRALHGVELELEVEIW